MIALKNISLKQGSFELSGLNLTLAAGEYAMLHVRWYKIDVAGVEDAQVTINHHGHSTL